MTDATDVCDVLIVGAGPSGVGAGILLAQHDLNVIVADKAHDIYPLPRAAHLDHEAMRILQAMGVADVVAALSRPATGYEFLTADRQVLMRFSSDAESSPSGWPASNMIHQPGVERVMRERLAMAPTAQLRKGWTLQALREASDGMHASFETPQGPREVRAAYAIGADGASSTVRQLHAIAQHDLAFDEPWLVIDTLVHDEGRLPGVNLQICDPTRPTTCVLMAPGRHRWEFMLLPGETADMALDDAFIARLLLPWDVEGAVTLERKAVYRFHALIAQRWRSGRVFLAGDAAHQMPPFAGQGLCSGLRDVANLAWKIAAVVRDDAPAALLDTYQSEREPHVRAITEMALMMGRTVCITDPAAAAARDAAMLAQRAAQPASQPPAIAWPPLAQGFILHGAPGAGELFPQPVAAQNGPHTRLDDVLGGGWWLIATSADHLPAPTAAPVTVAHLEEHRLADLSAPLQRWLTQRGATAALVRPDRYVFGAGTSDTLLEVRAAMLAP